MIDTEALRKKVIDLAIRGKLTEQLPSDGDAETLYAQIQDNKLQLIEEGKIKKDKALPDITADEIPFEIPNNWKWIRWGNAVNVVSARRVHQSDWRKEGIPFYRAREIATLADFGKVDNDLYISEELYNEFSRSGVPHGGDLMVTGVGTLGKTYVVKDNDRFYYKDASVLCFENYASLVAEYLKILMESSLMHSQIESNSGGTTVDTLTMVRMNQYIMPLPPQSEQKRIVNVIDMILKQIDIIDNLQAKYSNDLAVLKSKIINAGIQGKLTEQLKEDGNAEDLYKQIQEEKEKLIKEGKIKKEKLLPNIKKGETPFEIPKNWKWARLASLYEINPRVEADAETMAAFVPMEKISAGFRKDFTYDEQKWDMASKNHTKFQNDDVAFAKISPCFENRKSFIAKDLPNGVGGGTTELIILRQKAIFPEYTYYLITSQRFIDAGSTSYKGIVGQQRIKSDVVNSFLVPLPPYAEQIRIAKKIDEVLSYLND